MSGLRALALAALLAGAMPAAAEERPAVSEQLLALARASDEAQSRGEYALAASHLAELTTLPDFQAFTPDRQRQLQLHVARLAYDGGDLPRALTHARLATRFADAGFEEWSMRADAALYMDLPDEVADCVREIFQRWPERTRKEYDRFVTQVVWATKFDSPARFALLQALYEGGFEMAWTGAPDRLWLELALQYLARDDQDAAREVVARLQDPYVVAIALIDRRFDPVRDPALSAADLPALARRRADDLRARALLDPNVVGIQAEYANALLVLGEHEDAVALAEQVAAAIAGSRLKGDIFRDQQEELSWLYGRAGQALVRLGRKDEALAMWSRAAAAKEGGRANVSHVLDYAHHLVSAGKPREALEVVAAVGEMSDYGRMVLVSVQHRAALALGDGPAADAALDYLERNRSNGEAVYANALLDRGRDDAAAAALIARLEDPDQRTGALLSAQVYLPSETLDPAQEERYKALLRREDVQAAINRHGRILELPLY